MGHRANFVIIEGKDATAYYDHWAALSSTLIIADGPGEARDAASNSESVDELMEWAFAEAGYLLDFDQRRAIIFGVPDLGGMSAAELELDEHEAKEWSAMTEALEAGPKAFFAHVAPKWRGWTLIWDDRGVDAFAAHLENRGITNIVTQPSSHPEELSEVSELAVPA